MSRLIYGAGQALGVVFVLAPLLALLAAIDAVWTGWRWIELRAVYSGDTIARDRAEQRGRR